jgi:hypothetical protein
MTTLMRRSSNLISPAAIALAIFGALAATPTRAQSSAPQAPAQATTPGGKPAASEKGGDAVIPPGVKLVGQEPAAAAPRPFHFPQSATKTLPNGLRVFVVTDRSQPAVAARLVILSAGGIKDPEKLPGVAKMTAELLTQGTEKRSAQQIAEAIDFIGGSLDASAGKDSRASVSAS